MRDFGVMRALQEMSDSAPEIRDCAKKNADQDEAIAHARKSLRYSRVAARCPSMRPRKIWPLHSLRLRAAKLFASRL